MSGHSVAPGVPPATGPAIRVLIVDDDAGARTVHRRFVAEAPGFTLTAAVGTGLAAVEHGARGNVDLVLLDMRLPDISGVEVLNRLRTLGAHSPDVLVISSSQDRITVRQALAGQVVGYLVKPFTAHALLARLATYRAEWQQREIQHPGPDAESRPARDVPLGQGEIDQLLTTGRIRLPAATGSSPEPGWAAAAASGAPAGQAAPLSGGAPPLPKGISRVTLDRIIAALDPVAPHTVLALAGACAVSVPTARRYLDFLASAGQIDIAHRYGKRGRPEVLYRLVPPPAP